MKASILWLATLLFFTTPAGAEDRVSGEWRLAMAGDIMLGSDYPDNGLPPHQGRGLLDAAQPSLAWADLALGNLEGVLAQDGMAGKQGCTRCYVFRTPPEFAHRLKEAGFDGMSLANNHARDFGEEGLQQSQQALIQAGMRGTGWIGSAPAMFDHIGRRACLLAYAPNRGMNDIRDIPTMQAHVARAKTQCHLVVVSFHGGAEGQDKAHTPIGFEMYLGENRGDVRSFSRAAIDAGAHVVFGHGPHVPRGMELYNGHLIAYSLGNFMTYGGMSVAGISGQAPLVLVRLDGQGKLISGRIVSFRQTRKQPLRLDPDAGAARTIMTYTQSDFAGGRLAFTADAGFRPAR